MRQCIHPSCQTADNGQAVPGQIKTGVSGDLLPVSGNPPGAHHRNSKIIRRQKRPSDI